jgi:endonuclease-3
MGITKKEKVISIIETLEKLFPNSKIALNYKTPWELFVAVVLSAQTTDKKVNEITPALFAKYKTPKDFSKIRQEELERYIRSIGLYRAKARNIIQTAKIINQKYKGILPDSMKILISLPGVGRKTANVLLGNIYGVHEGIAVDTHVKRLAYLFGLTDSQNPEVIEKELMQIVPKKYWGIITYLLIDYGRKYCTAYCKHNDCSLRGYIEKSR